MGEGGGQKYPKNDPHGLQMSPNYFLLFQIAGGWTTNGNTPRVELLNLNDFDNGWYPGKHEFLHYSEHQMKRY